MITINREGGEILAVEYAVVIEVFFLLLQQKFEGVTTVLYLTISPIKVSGSGSLCSTCREKVCNYFTNNLGTLCA